MQTLSGVAAGNFKKISRQHSGLLATGRKTTDQNKYGHLQRFYKFLNLECALNARVGGQTRTCLAIKINSFCVS